ncbi:MAG TPA: FtsX-like permease family protein [Steroidobacteraceae bacterium]|nr:FtsX-like permease family protein [Steroidobacteraceae bacterium]
MLRNYLAAALRNIARSRFYATISILGLAVGLSAALLVGLIVHHDMTYDHFIPGYDRTYLIATIAIPAGHPRLYDAESTSWLAEDIRTHVSGVEGVTRTSRSDVMFRRGQVESREAIYWADPNVFDILPLRAIAGDLGTALHQPDSIVLTRSKAREYFGTDAPLGASLLVSGIDHAPGFSIKGSHPMTVTAVIEDLPGGTELETGIFASGLSSYSPQSVLAANPRNRPGTGAVLLTGRTYVRLSAPERLQSLLAAMPELIREVFPPRTFPPGIVASLEPVRIDRVNRHPSLNPGFRSRLGMLALVGALTLLVATVNFINLAVARSPRRALEIGIRKASGAGSRDLLIQFLGESMIYTGIAACVAVALTELVLPRVSALLDLGVKLELLHTPALIGWIALTTLLFGALAGLYPASALRDIRPARALHGFSAGMRGARVRQALVTIQFAALIGLVIGGGVIYQQRNYAAHAALRLNTDQMLMIRAPCETAFENALRELPGVRGAYCSDAALLDRAQFGNFRLADGSTLAVDVLALEPGLLQLYGLKPLAGQLPERAATGAAAGPAGYILNETAVERLGFSSPAAAVGQRLPFVDPHPEAPIVAVVPDFSIDTVHERIRPGIFMDAGPTRDRLVGRARDDYSLFSVKLRGRDIPETLAAIDALWKRTGHGAPIDRFFLNSYIQTLYVTVLRQAQSFAACAAVAVLLACLGLAGLSTALANQRTKEIGIRKAMGAQTHDILRLLLWQFAKPVLWASLLAWAAAAALMSRWLESFAYHITLDPVLFVAAAAGALLLALATVAAHCYAIARAKPILALRYE